MLYNPRYSAGERKSKKGVEHHIKATDTGWLKQESVHKVANGMVML